MKFSNLKEETIESIKVISIAGIIIVIFYLLMNNIPAIAKAFSVILNAIAPFLVGIIMSFIVAPLRTEVETKWLSRFSWSKKTKRKIGTLVAMVALFLGVFLFFSILIPQLADSLSIFIASFDGYVKTFQEMVMHFNAGNPELAQFINEGLTKLGSALTQWLIGAQGGMAQILSYSISFAKGVANFFIGMIITIYILLDEEKFKKQIKMIIYSIFNLDAADSVMYVLRLTAATFNNFIFGKFIDSLIVGIICYICVTIMKLPYAPLIAFVVGLTNMIPVFGPFIGAIPCALILLIIDPMYCLEFLVFILILQQVDGNIIGPHILSGAVGLPTMWVMFAIIVGGALFGIVGMFIGIPIFSVIYTLTENWVHKRLKEKNLQFTDGFSDE